MVEHIKPFKKKCICGHTEMLHLNNNMRSGICFAELPPHARSYYCHCEKFEESFDSIIREVRESA